MKKERSWPRRRRRRRRRPSPVHPLLSASSTKTRREPFSLVVPRRTLLSLLAISVVVVSDCLVALFDIGVEAVLEERIVHEELIRHHVRREARVMKCPPRSDSPRMLRRVVGLIVDDRRSEAEGEISNAAVEIGQRVLVVLPPVDDISSRVLASEVDIGVEEQIAEDQATREAEGEAADEPVIVLGRVTPPRVNRLLVEVVDQHGIGLAARPVLEDLLEVLAVSKHRGVAHDRGSRERRRR